MNKEDIDMAYLAGVMDGDGSFSIGRLSKSSLNPLYFALIQCSKWRLEFLHALKEKFGGSLFQRPMHICKDGSNGHALTIWKLRSNKNCRGALEKLIPFLKIKQERAEFLLKFIDSFEFVRGKALTLEKIVDRERSYLKMLSFNSSRNSSENISKKLAKVTSLDPIFWSYLAGIMDTDGSFSIKKQVSNKGTFVKNARYIPAISIGMCDTRAINYIRENCSFGNFCVPNNKATTKGVHYHFQIHSKRDGCEFLEMVLPFLKTKVENAKILLDFCKNSKNTLYCKIGVSEEELAFRESCHSRLVLMNKYGVFKPTLIDLEVQKQDDKAEG